MPVSYAADINHLFRPKDIASMQKNGSKFDLSLYADVVRKADDILAEMKSGDMPCDGAWPQQDIDTFQQWIADGKLP